MRRYVSTIAVIAALYVGLGQLDATHDFFRASTATNETIANAFREQRSGVEVVGRGVVTRVLADDTDGSRHQRFILRLDSGQTLLVAHNIDIAPRLASLASGDVVEFKGVYEWNSKGGVIHWTHRDPNGAHQAGWLKYQGGTYQ
jgi:hypothetical protein